MSTPSSRVLPMGETALLLACGDLAEVTALHAQLREHPLPGQVEAIAGARTVLVRFLSPRDARSGADALAELRPAPLGHAHGRTVTVDVVYDGEDLPGVAAMLGWEADAVIAAHTGTLWVGAFGGFAPGFTYCAPIAEGATAPPWPSIPRRPSPRTAVPSGSVALAGEFSAAYPRTSPGGWQLLGHTDAVLWDLDRADSPALIGPGDRVRYRAVRARVRMSRRGGPGVTATEEVPVASALEVIRPGPLLLIEDGGRPGRGDLGVGASGAADPAAARAANRTVGNQPGAAVLEILAGHTVLRARGAQVVAVTGAEVDLQIAGRDGVSEAATARPLALADGDELHLGPARGGLRVWLAVRGGIDVPPVLGSRSRDTLAGIGPAPVSAGQVLPVGPVTGLDAVPLDAEPIEHTEHEDTAPVLPILWGPRADWFTAASREALTAQPWEVTAASDRVGLRLRPSGRAEPLTRTPAHVERELPSEGMVTGAIQVPPSGEPVVFGVDHPVTGGYPVVAVVAEAALPLLARLGPGDHLRFSAPRAGSAPRSGPRSP